MRYTPPRGTHPEGLRRSLYLRLPLLVLLALVTSSEARGACPAPVTGEQLRLLVDDAEAAWTRLDPPAFTATADTLATALPCLAEPLDRALVARYHRVQGLRAFLARNSTRTRAAFAATRAVEPGAGLPTSFAPAGHPLQAEFRAVPLEAVTTERVPNVVYGTLSFDARIGQERPENVPTVFQWRGADGAVETTAYVWPEDPLPAYPVLERRRTRRALLIGAAAAGVAAAGLTVTAALAAEAYDTTPDTCASVEELERLRGLVNGSNGAAIGLAIAAGGTAIVAFTVPFGS